MEPKEIRTCYGTNKETVDVSLKLYITTRKPDLKMDFNTIIEHLYTLS